MGRPPKLKIDKKVNHKSNDEFRLREEHTPVYKSREFMPPKSLTKDELVIWNDLVKIIRDMDGSFISDADIMTMEVYCKSKAEYDRACKEWEKNPELYVNVGTGNYDKNGEEKTTVRLNSNYVIKKDFSKLMLKYLDQLGISPIGRAKQGLKSAKNELEKRREELKAIFNRSDD